MGMSSGACSALMSVMLKASSWKHHRPKAADGLKAVWQNDAKYPWCGPQLSIVSFPSFIRTSENAFKLNCSEKN